MTNKNPYEIRLEILKMAQDAAIQHFYANRETVIRNWEVQVSAANERGETPPSMPELPEFPTEQTVVNKAQFLSEYINNNGKQTV